MEDWQIQRDTIPETRTRPTKGRLLSECVQAQCSVSCVLVAFDALRLFEVIASDPEIYKGMVLGLSGEIGQV